ncbi:MAG TPA: hypothetical protein VGN63_16480 [Flavisolibacter sp.]|jgi:hypothetical protein|nr:hypothetical protein [Flavisolibacter sp.]
MKKYSVLFILLFAAAVQTRAQRTDQPWQVDLAAGLHSFYAPIENLKFQRPELVATGALHKLLHPKQLFSVGLQVGFARNNYQGDAVFVQLMGQFTPVIADHIELGIGMGAGYRFAFYPASPLQWTGADWKKGRGFKGMVQAPVQLSVGYRSIKWQALEIRPYAAYQLQALFGYNPDLSPLPVSNFLMGLKIHNYKK